MYAATSEALSRVIDLTREMLDELRTAEPDRDRIAIELNAAIHELHTELRLRHKLSRADADALLGRTLSEVGQLVQNNGISAYSGVA